MENRNSRRWPNIYWIVVDCVRNYVSGKDDRDKLEVMFKLAEECVDFENMIVSAPSSIMSISTAMTSIPSYYIAGNYVDFKFDSHSFWCLKDLLQTVGYKTYGIFNTKTSREKLRGMFDLVDKKHWTPRIKHSHIAWPNIEVSETFFNALNDNQGEPSFYLLWYNSRRDPKISQQVEEVVNELKTRGLFYESIFILTSDHGYPDLSRGLIADGWDLKKVGLPHDLVLTDDNIRVPFLLSYPGVRPVKVKQTVCSEDVLPTLLELLDVTPPFLKSLPSFGQSMLPLIRGEIPEFFKERKIRSDARFSMQGGRVTSLRSNSHKYIIHHDTGKEEFYDLVQDPGEKTNLAGVKQEQNLLSSFRDEFVSSEREVITFQIEKINERFRPCLEDQNNPFEEATTVWAVVFGKSHLYRGILGPLIDKYPELNIYLTLPAGMEPPKKWELASKVTHYTKSAGLDLQSFRNKPFDIRLEIVDDRVSPLFQNCYHLFSSIKAKSILRVDSNLELKERTWRFLNNPRFAYYWGVLKDLYAKKDLFRLEPSYFFVESKRLAKLFFNLYFSRSDQK